MFSSKNLIQPHVIIRDYHTEVWLWTKVSPQDPIISQKALARVIIVKGYNPKPVL